jgi:hypothetical protein
MLLIIALSNYEQGEPISLKLGIAKAIECVYFACFLLSLVNFTQPTYKYGFRKLIR